MGTRNGQQAVDACDDAFVFQPGQVSMVTPWRDLVIRVFSTGATVLLVPLVVNMAIRAGIDPRMAALVVGLATSNSFILPTHQVNALYMGPGHYRSVDYMSLPDDVHPH